MFGLTPEEYTFLATHVVNPLELSEAKVWCFGSRARGDFSRFSDIDLMVEPGNIDVAAQVSRIRDFLSNSNFPYKVDIVLLPEFAESYKSGYLRDRKPFVSPSQP